MGLVWDNWDMGKRVVLPKLEEEEIEWDIPEDYDLPVSPNLKVTGKELTEAEALYAGLGTEELLKVALNRALSTGTDWNKIAHEATRMYLTGKYTQEQIAKELGVSIDALRNHVSLERIRMTLLGEVAASAYADALQGDKEMKRFILDRQGGFNAKSEVKHSGEIELRPILNIGPKLLKQPKTIEVINEKDTGDV